MLKFNQNPIVSLCSQNLNTVRGHVVVAVKTNRDLTLVSFYMERDLLI